MDQNLKNKIENYIETIHILKEEMKTVPNIVRFYLAYCLDSNKDNIKKVKEIKNYIKNNTPWYSFFRERTNLNLISGLLVNEPIYPTLFNEMVSIYQLLKPAITFGSPFLLYASFIIAKSDDNNDVLINRSLQFYQDFKNNHRFFTSAYDFVNASILASFDQFNQVDDIEKCYHHLRGNGFRKSASTYKLAQLLMLSKIDFFSTNNWKALAKETKSLSNKLKEKSVGVDYYALPLLGLASLLDLNTDTLANEISKVVSFLTEFKEFFGFWKCSKSNRVLIAIAIVYDYYFETASIANPVLTNQLILKIIMATIITKRSQDEAAAAAAA